MKTFVSIWLLLMAIAQVFGQSSIRLNNSLENLHTINPGYIDADADILVSLATRKQWMGFPGAPATFFATGSHFFSKLDTQIGVQVLNDKIGFTNVFNAAASYAYCVHINDEWNLNLGIAASFQNLSYDLAQVTEEIANNPSLYTRLLNTNNVNTDLGAHLTNKNWSFGLASQNVFSIFFPENRLQTNTNLMYAKYHKPTENYIDFQWGVSAFQYRNMFQMEFNLTAYIKPYMGNDLLQLGAIYRTRSEVCALLGVNLSPTLHLWYSFDCNINGISRNTMGTHEVMLVYRLDHYRPRN